MNPKTQTPRQSPHDDPALFGQTFGCATVTVDMDLGDCVLTVTIPGIVDPTIRTARLHSVDEIEGAYFAQRDIAAKGAANPNVANADVARDCAAALKFALKRLNAQARGNDVNKRMWRA